MKDLLEISQRNGKMTRSGSIQDTDDMMNRNLIVRIQTNILAIDRDLGRRDRQEDHDRDLALSHDSHLTREDKDKNFKSNVQIEVRLIESKQHLQSARLTIEKNQVVELRYPLEMILVIVYNE